MALGARLQIEAWQFDLFELHQLTGGHSLSALGWAIAERHGLRQALSIPAGKFVRFLRTVEEGYRDVPYHNSIHGACVTHSLYQLISQTSELTTLFVDDAPVELLTAVCMRLRTERRSCACRRRPGIRSTSGRCTFHVHAHVHVHTLDAWQVIAGLVHDIGHTGHSNAFHVASGSEYAVLYSDQSVLEMHHLATAWKILGQQETDILASLDLETRRELRANVISMVLSTDLSVNFTTINAFKQMIDSKGAALAAAEGGGAESETSLATPEHSRASSYGHGRASMARMSTAASARMSTATSSNSSESMGGGRPTMAGRRRGSRRGEHVLGMWQAAGVPLAPSDLLLILKMLIKVLARRTPIPPRAAPRLASPRLIFAMHLVLTVQLGCGPPLLCRQVSDISNVTKGQAYCLGWTDRVVEEFFAQGDLEAQLKLPVNPMMNRATACVPKQQVGFYNIIVRPMYEAMDKLIPMAAPLANLDAMQEYWTARLPVEEAPPASVTPQPPALGSLPPPAALNRKGSNLGRFVRRVSSGVLSPAALVSVTAASASACEPTADVN